MAHPPEPATTNAEVRELLLQLSSSAPTTDTEQASIDEHSAHRLTDVTTSGDTRRQLLCLDCNETFNAGPIRRGRSR